MNRRAARILVLDNRDSFTFNVVQALREAGASVGVVDARSLGAGRLGDLRVDGLVISPGPGRPEGAPVSLQALELLADRVPVWGICLGHQCLATWRGAKVRRADRVLHGKASSIHHDGQGLFTGLTSPLVAMRYHSLVVDPATLGPALAVSAWTEEGEIMGLRCRRTGAEGVQFHPESILSGAARPMFTAFVDRCVAGRRSLEGAA